MNKIPLVNLGLNYMRLRDEILSIFDELSKKGAYVLTEEVRRFEKNFAEYCGTKYAIGVANGGEALFLSLKALGVGPGDEVITVPNTFIATAWAIIAAGARPVFVDVREDFNINPLLIEKAITSKTKAIIPVHFTGRPAEMDPILDIAKKYNLHIIEDAAQAIGAEYKGKRTGTFGVLNCFSLHPLKNLHVHGDGGVITTDSQEYYELLLKLRNNGLKNRDECEIWGFNSRLDGIQAAIADLKLKHIDQWNRRYIEIAEKYIVELSPLVSVPTQESHIKSVYHRFMIRTERRNALQQFLQEAHIESKAHYPIPLHLQECAKNLGYKRGSFPVAERLSDTILSIPLYSELTDDQANYVIEQIKNFFNNQ